MSNDNIAFRKSIRGYNKKDVYKFLESVNKDISEKSAEYEKKITQLEKENEILTRDLSSKNEKLDMLNALCEEKDEALRSNEHIITSLREDLKDKENTVSSLNREIKEKETLIEELDSATVKISIELDRIFEQYKEISDKYEAIATELGELDELRYKADSYDKIISRAKQKKSDSPIQSSEYPYQATKEKNEIDAIKTDIDSILSGSADMILEHIRQTQQKFTTAIMNAQSETDALKERINSVIRSSKEQILSQIKD